MLRPPPLPLIVVLAAALLTAACGQKGPLYLPDKPPPAEAKKYPQKPAQPTE